MKRWIELRPKPANAMALAGALVLLVACNGGNAKSQEQRTYGNIKTIDLPGRIIVVSEKKQGGNAQDIVKIKNTYKVAFDCKISTIGQRKADLADLRVGDRVNIRFTVQDGILVAHKITPRGTGRDPKATDD